MERTHTGTATTIENKFGNNIAPCGAAVRYIFVQFHIHRNTLLSYPHIRMRKPTFINNLILTIKR
jgi:hypothetical protein